MKSTTPISFSLLIGLWIFCLGSVMGQNPQTLAYLRAADQLVLVQDQQQQIPLAALHSWTMHVHTIGLSEDAVFTKVVQRYLPIVGHSAEWRKVVADEGAGLKQLHLIAINTDANLSKHEITQLKGLLSQSKKISTIWVFFGSGVLLEQYPELGEHQQAIIYTPGHDMIHQSLAVQLIFGGVGTSARLDMDLGKRFKNGSGLSRVGGIRLAYAPPEIVGLDGSLLRDSIDAIAQAAINAKAFPGMQVLIARKGKVVFHKAYGHHRYEQKQLVQLDDLYDFASVTKITSALPALMQLYGQARFDLDAPLSKY